MKDLSITRKPLPPLIASVMLLGAIFLVADSCSTSEKQPPVQAGNELFQTYCVICHGKYADGKGNMADRLNTPPMNLTTIAKRRGGNFPEEEIFNTIAGKEGMPGHSGSGEMPPWWDTIKKSENLTKDKEVSEKINQIVAYLKEIQKE